MKDRFLELFWIARTKMPLWQIIWIVRGEVFSGPFTHSGYADWEIESLEVFLPRSYMLPKLILEGKIS